MFVEQIPNEDLNLKNTGIFSWTHPTSRFQLSRENSPKAGRNGMWAAQEPPSATQPRVITASAGETLGPCAGNSSSAPWRELHSTLSSPIGRNFPADLTVHGFAATATIKGKLYPHYSHFSWPFPLVAGLLKCSSNPWRGTPQEGHSCFPLTFHGCSAQEWAHLEISQLNMVCYRGFMHTKGELVKIIISFPFFIQEFWQKVSGQNIFHACPVWWTIEVCGELDCMIRVWWKPEITQGNQILLVEIPVFCQKFFNSFSTASIWPSLKQVWYLVLL